MGIPRLRETIDNMQYAIVHPEASGDSLYGWGCGVEWGKTPFRGRRAIHLIYLYT